jgi:branched-chain amino acid transport system permease protein
MQLLLPIFASAIVGGVGNPLGAIAGGYTIAFSEIVVTFAYKKVVIYLGLFEPDSLVQFLSTDYKIAVSFFLLVIVLIVKPTGIFGGKTL